MKSKEAMEISPALIDKYKVILGVDSLPLYWTEQEVADLGIRSIHSLRRDRIFGNGIPFVKVKEGGSVRYSVVCVLEWLHNNSKTTTSTSKTDAT